MDGGLQIIDVSMFRHLALIYFTCLTNGTHTKKREMISKAIIKQKLRVCHRSTNPFIRYSVFPLFVLRHAIYLLNSFLFNPDFRATTFLQIFNTEQVHQTTSLTFMNRYPDIFWACREYLGDKESLKILSYGCSTGEEVLTLRHYFPSATIVGAELNRRSLAICRKLPVDPKISFIYSTSDHIKNNGPYDVIFCLAVFQRRPGFIAEKGIIDLKKIYPFEKFDCQISELDSTLKPEGLFVVHFSQYSMMDTSVANRYEPYGNVAQAKYVGPVFGKNSKKVGDSEPFKSIYLKSKDY